ncbi:competence type IV pilus minor pilin ComGG [Salipaludibacillus aurantiacus]|uniref:ComG operon protein 7 n=1 Tax=Salipaludibacillus aurantiacus TaxID=1601833 RepID=A0A1H9PNU8_9BACI|nr:competence type IV pilus minor pilin ComGG [Salipaludibacillus aurantiacus]SER49862.1 ComG operon protein 7 [Salipaludibacillus aurantiacus]
MNQQGFTLFIVLLILLFFSMFIIHLVGLYKFEKQFSALEFEQYKLEQLIFNGKLEVTDVVEKNSFGSRLSGSSVYYEGTVFYEIEQPSPELVSVSLRAQTHNAYAKSVTFIYNTESKTFEQWTELGG